MTDLRKTVRRVTVEEVASVRRRVVVALEPGDVIAFREARRRRWYRAPIGKVFITVAQWNIAAERAERRAAKQRGKA
jgi:hypothetical protein